MNTFADEKTEINIINILKNDFGHFGFALSKNHYDGDEICLNAYTELKINSYLVLVRQFSNFFGYRIQM